MDVNKLSKEIYNATLVDADAFDHELALQFKLIADESADETEYLKKSKLLIEEIRNYDDDEVEDLFFETNPSRIELNTTLDKILENISGH